MDLNSLELVMKKASKIPNKKFLTGMNIFFLAIAIGLPVYTEIQSYYVRSVNPRVEYSFSDLISILTICSIYVFGVIFDVLHRQHKRIQELEQDATASREGYETKRGD